MQSIFWKSLPLLTLCVLLTAPVLAEDAPYLAGLAERDITPEIGMEQPGGYGKAFHRTLHDPCKVRAAVFTSGDQTVAIVSVDALLVRRATVQKIRQQVAEKVAIKPGAILIHATHSHSSGPTGMILPGEYDQADDFIQKLAYEESSTADARYLARFETQTVDAIVEAFEKRTAVTCSAGTGQEGTVAFNRRFRMRDGLTFTHPRQGNPDIIEPAGPIDPEVGVVGVWNSDGKLLGCLVNFSCHATTSPGGISANYIYYVEQVIRGVFGDQAVLVFLAGASGDVTQVDNLSPYVFPASEDWARLVGGRVGAEAVKQLLEPARGPLTPVAHASKILSIPRRPPSDKHVAEARKIVEGDRKAVDATTWTFAKETLLLDARLAWEPVAEVEVQAVQLGPVVMLTDPAEFFVQLGLDIKAGSPFPMTWPVSLSNGCVGYVPTEEAFSPRGGGYETRLSSYSNLEITAGTQMVNAAIELSRALTPGTIPTRPKAAPFSGGGWGYGSLPPQLD